MTWRKIRLMWIFWPLVMGLGVAIGLILKGDQLPIAVPGAAISVLLLVRMASIYWSMEPEEIVAEQKNRKEMWIILCLAIILQVTSVFLWSLVNGSDRLDEQWVLYISLVILIPAVLLSLFRGMRRARDAKRAAAKRLAAELSEN